MEADHGSPEESRTHHRLQGLHGQSKIARSAQYTFHDHFKNGAAALDKTVELEDVAKNVIGNTDFQNEARVFRSEYRKVLGTELIREVILK
jgi:hypothetical protein